MLDSANGRLTRIRHVLSDLRVSKGSIRSACVDKPHQTTHGHHGCFVQFIVKWPWSMDFLRNRSCTLLEFAELEHLGGCGDALGHGKIDASIVDIQRHPHPKISSQFFFSAIPTHQPRGPLGSQLTKSNKSVQSSPT